MLVFEHLHICPEATLPCRGYARHLSSVTPQRRDCHRVGSSGVRVPCQCARSLLCVPRTGGTAESSEEPEPTCPVQLTATAPNKTFCFCPLPRGSPVCCGHGVTSRRDDVLLAREAVSRGGCASTVVSRILPLEPVKWAAAGVSG